MPAKPTALYRCEKCGNETAKWGGQCPSCGAWNTLAEAARKTSGRYRPPNLHPISISEIRLDMHPRRPTGSGELDRVLGGGMVSGSSVLLGGEPGIGKSTLMLQVAAAAKGKDSLYVSGEESPRQIKSRAERLGYGDTDMYILCSSVLGDIMTNLERMKPALVIIDSIQTLAHTELGSVAGLPNQARYCSGELIEWARHNNACIFFIAHVTKEGSIAGPKSIEHMVDTVLYFEQSGSDVRFLRAIKNRSGSVDEIGLFEMGSTGLKPVENPHTLFLTQRSGYVPSGIAVAPIYEGSRVFLVEIQALTVPAKGGISRVFSDRIDARRIARLAAVMERHMNVPFADQDIYVNVAGGIRIDEVGVDLPLAHALYSARNDTPMRHDAVVTGEVSLAGEALPVPHLRQRIKAARELGYRHCFAPNPSRGKRTAIDWRAVETLEKCIGYVFDSSVDYSKDSAPVE